MTIIGAKVIRWKWTLFSDDIISQWDMKYNASKNYRAKIRTLPRAPHDIYVATAWTCRESDLIVNMLDKTIKDTRWWANWFTSLELLDAIQETIVSWCKTLKEVSEDNPQFSLLILDVDLNTVYFVEEFSVKILADNVECVCWSWQYLFYKFRERQVRLTDENAFRDAFIEAALIDDWCWCPIYETNWKDFYTYDEDWKIIAEKHLE